MEEKKVITYSLLAHINNNLSTKGIKDLSEIFVPLVKRVISKLYQEGIDEGQIKDLKEGVDSKYGFNMPYPILIKIVQMIANEANQESGNEFQFHGDYSFMIKKYIFSEYEDFLNKQDSEIDFLSNAYTNFIKSKGLNPDSQLSIFEFLDKNRVNVSQFFAKKEVLFIDSTNTIQGSKKGVRVIFC